MDEDGVDAEMLYPPQRAMLTFMKNKDKDAHLAGIRAYNRWLKDGFCAPDPDRLIGIFQTPNVGIETSVAELKRAKKEGYRGVAISAWPSGGDILSREDDPFWDAAAELDMPVSIHLLLAAQQTKTRGVEGGRRSRSAPAPSRNTMPLITELIFQGVFDRFPKLRMAGVEVGRRLDPALPRDDRRPLLAQPPPRRRQDQEGPERVLPRPLARDLHRRPQRHQVRHQVGIENMAWSTDFPHHGNDWPYSRKTIDTLFADVPADERQKIVCTNAARFWGLVS